MTRREYLSWSRILEALKLEVDFWDIERYEGISYNSQNQRHPLTWIGRYERSTRKIKH
jgi:hypothetical protein